MTEENRRENAAIELARAEECLREARALHAAVLPYGAASRAYYSVYHAAKALLFSVGLEPRTHRGVVSLVGEHFVKTGRLSTEMGRTLAHLQRDREDADYATGAVFTEKEAVAAIADAQSFLDSVSALMGEKA